MAVDAHKNFAVSTVATAPSPATSGTSLVVASGHGARFPAVPFNATVWPASSQPAPSNAEVVRVTAISTDTLTITRAQEGSTARSIGAGDQIAAGITAKTLTDVEGALFGDYHPGMNGCLAANFDPSMALNNTSTTDGKLVLTKVYLASAQTITNVVFYLTSGQGGPANTSNFVGIYDTSGNLKGGSASLTAAQLSAGTVVLPLSSPVALAAGFYYVASLTNEAGGVPAWASHTNGQAPGVTEVNNTTATSRGLISTASFSTSTASLPATINLATDYGQSAFAGTRWVGLS